MSEPDQNSGPSQGRQDAAEVARGALRGAAKGAATGGLYGAAAGAAKGAAVAFAKSKTARKIAVALVCLLVIGGFFLSQLVTSIITVTAEAATEAEAQHDSTRVITGGEDRSGNAVTVNGKPVGMDDLVSLVEATSGSQVPWQLMLSLTQTRSTPRSTVGSVGTVVDGVTLSELDDCVDGQDPLEGLKPNAQLVMKCGSAFVRATFGDVGADIETWHGVGHRALNSKSDHPNGRAVDAMVAHHRGGTFYDYTTPEAIELGDALAQFYTEHAAELGIHYVIWNAKIWRSDNNDGWVEYAHPSGATDDTNMHLDHIHVSVYESGQETGESGGDTALPGRGGNRTAGGVGKYNILANEEMWRRQLDRLRQEEPLTTDGVDTAALDAWLDANPFYPMDRDEVLDEHRSDALVASWLAQMLLEAASEPGLAELGSGTAQREDGSRVLLTDSHADDSYYSPVSVAAGERTRALYVEVVSRLPIAGMDRRMAQTVYDRAMAWYLGQEYQATKGGRCYFTGGDLGNLGDSDELGSYVGKRADGTAVVLNEDQLAAAATIIAVAADLGATPEQIQVALMTALQESSLLMYANSTVPESLEYPHQAVGSDHDSLGWFQQRPAAGWGSVADLMDGEYNVRAFFGGPDGPNQGSPPGLFDLEEQGRLVGKSLGEQAQAVQVSAFPFAYDKWEPVAADLIQLLGGVECSSANIIVDGWAKPVPAEVRMNSGFGYRGNIGVPGAAAFHYGADYAAPKGTPIYAAAAGEVIWAGWSPTTWWSGVLVMIDHGNGLYSTYNHMDEDGVHVQVGDIVEAGQHIADIGLTGNTSGYHLHFSIFHHDGDPMWPRSSSFYDPVEFLAEQGVDAR